MKNPPSDPAVAALKVVRPSNSCGVGDASQPQHCVAAAQPSSAVVVTLAAAHNPVPAGGNTEAAAAMHDGAALLDDPDVPCFDLGI